MANSFERKPVIFISCTSELEKEGSALRHFLKETLGYEANIYTHTAFPYPPNMRIVDQCYRNAATSDILILLLGTNPGSLDKQTGHPIIWGEYQEAKNKGLVRYVFVKNSVNKLFEECRKNPILMQKNKLCEIFKLIKEIRGEENVVTRPWKTREDIQVFLKEQLAYLFGHFLRKKPLLTSSAEWSTLKKKHYYITNEKVVICSNPEPNVFSLMISDSSIGGIGFLNLLVTKKELRFLNYLTQDSPFHILTAFPASIILKGVKGTWGQKGCSNVEFVLNSKSQIISYKERIKIDKRIYNCLLVETKFHITPLHYRGPMYLKRNIWFAKGIGVIKISLIYNDNKEDIGELINYKISTGGGYFPAAIGNEWNYRWKITHKPSHENISTGRQKNGLLF